MPLFHKEVSESTVFNKQDIIQEIRENLKNKLPMWDWMVSKDGAFFTSDFVFFRSHEIKEEIHRAENPYNPFKKTVDSVYQTIVAVYIEESYRNPEIFNGGRGYPLITSIEVSSAKDLYRMLKKIDLSNGG